MHLTCRDGIVKKSFLAFITLLLMAFFYAAYSVEGHTDKGDASKVSESKGTQGSPVPLEKRMRGFEQFASKIRELEFKKPVKYINIRKEEVKALFNKKLEQQYSDKEFSNKVEAYVKIGLLKSPEGVREAMLGMLGEQIAGFYDTDYHVLYTISDLGFDPQFDAMIYIHELTHALQDQHFNLNSLGINDKRNDDRATAAMALIEGDATLVIMQYFTKYGKFSFRMLAQAMTMDSTKLQAAPYVLRRSLMFPYMDGMTMVTKLQVAKGWEGINEAFRNPPTTTEQILHPGKYFKNIDRPAVVKLPNMRRALGRDWCLLDDNVMGELNTQILFDIHLGKRLSKKPSAGWDGDRYNVLKNIRNGTMIFVWSTVWDSVKDADEFFTAYLRLLEKKYPGIMFVRSDTADLSMWRSDGLSILVARKGGKALVIEAPDDTLLGKTLKRCDDFTMQQSTLKEGEK